MNIKEIMESEVVVVLESMSVVNAAGLLLRKKVNAAPVIDDDGKLVGVISEKDLFRAFYPNFRDFYTNYDWYLLGQGLDDHVKEAGRKTVGEIMPKNFFTAKHDADVLKIGGKMVATGVHRVPVVENEKLIGLISRHNVYRSILRSHFGLL